MRGPGRHLSGDLGWDPRCEPLFEAGGVHRGTSCQICTRIIGRYLESYLCVMYEEYDFDGVDKDCGTYWKGIQDRPTYKVVLGIPFYAQPGWTDYGAILAAAPEASDGDRVFIMVWRSITTAWIPLRRRPCMPGNIWAGS